MFLDTSGLLCFINPREQHHPQAVDFVGRAPYRLTHTLVIAELTATAIRARIPPPTVFAVLDDLEADPSVEIAFVNETLYQRGLHLLRRRPDKRWSLCDAVSFIVMNDHNMREALTTDRHFEQAGYARLLA